VLTAAAIRAAGLPLAGWVANHIVDMPYASENVAALEERLAAPLIARIPNSARPDAALVAAQLRIERLQ
jgi:dethiobiotin synthetase